MFFGEMKSEIQREQDEPELKATHPAITKGPQNVFARDDGILVSMPSKFVPATEKVTEKNYQLDGPSSLVPLSDEKGSTKIDLNTEGFKRAYDAKEFEYMMAPKKKTD